MRFAPLWLGLLLLSSSCSLLGLDGYVVPQCDDDTMCDPLNARHGISDTACLRYQCNANRVCELRVRDGDDDGHASAACAGDPGCSETPCDDCDDTSAVAFPGGMETCDGADNDCNGEVDDAVGTAQASALLLEGLDDSTSSIAYAPIGEPQDGVAVSTARGSQGSFNPFSGDLEPAILGTVGYVRGAALATGMELSDSTLEPGCAARFYEESSPPAGSVVCTATPMRDCTMLCQTHAECSDGILCNGYETCEPNSPASDMNGCRAPMNAACMASATCSEDAHACIQTRGTPCDFAELAASRFATGLWLTAAINSVGCAAGRVYVGYLSESGANPSIDGSDPGRNFLLRGDDRRTTSYLGVDLDETAGGPGCTGGSRAAEEPRGAAHIAIAALPADPPMRPRAQGLVAWLAPPGPDGTSLVEVMGVFHEEEMVPAGPVVGWVSGTGGGRPERLDVRATSTGDAPALVALPAMPGGGWALGYGGAAGGVAIQLVGAMPAPGGVAAEPPYHTRVQRPSPTCSTPADCETGWTCELAGCIRTTPPITTIGPSFVLPGGGAPTAVVHDVAIAAREDATLGVAFRQDDGIWFSSVPLPTTSGSAPVQIAATTTATDLAISYAPEGFRTDIDETGGWYVTWVDGRDVRGRRVAEADGQPVESRPIVLVDDASTAPRAPQPARFVSGDGQPGTRVLYHAPADHTLRVVPTFCGPLE